MQDTLSREKNDAMASGKITYLSTAEAYDLWSEVYDTDGNFLQALDTIEMRSLLPQAISGIQPTRSTVSGDESNPTSWKAVDLGCGTGRNTLHLLDFDVIEEVVGLELSPKMMEIAKQACESKLSLTGKQKKLSFSTYDMIATTSIPPASATNADLVVSTLVLEHVPLDVFFQTCANILRPGGVLLMTNMHSEMGKISQAGFVDPKTGDKIRPVSYAHTLRDVIDTASGCGLELVSRESVKEVTVDEQLAEVLGHRGKKWIGVTVWFGGIWKKAEVD